MNPRTLPVKRRPVSNGFFKRIHAVTRHRNQRVATTANPEDFENPDQSSRISRGFTIIFLIHVVAIALYFIHLNFLNDHSVATASPPATTETAANPKARVQDAPIISPDDATCLVVAGDNYASIAAREGVDVEELRAINKNKPIAAGLTFKLPPKRIVAVDSPMVVALRKQTPSDADRGLVEPVEEEPAESTRPQVVHPKVVRETVNSKSNKDSAATKSNKESTAGKTSKETTASRNVKESTGSKTSKEATASKTGKESTASKSTKDSTASRTTKETPPPKATPVAAKSTYVVKPGDNLYRISKRYKIDQTALMKANNISDPAKLTSGTTLVIPH